MEVAYDIVKRQPLRFQAGSMELIAGMDQRESYYRLISRISDNGQITDGFGDPGSRESLLEIRTFIEMAMRHLDYLRVKFKDDSLGPYLDLSLGEQKVDDTALSEAMNLDYANLRLMKRATLMSIKIELMFSWQSYNRQAEGKTRIKW